MVLAVFSDIHGNIYSLEKALTIMATFKPDQSLFLGDMAGYYYYQNECIQMLKGLHNLTAIKGNHDDYFLKALDEPSRLNELDQKYGKSYSLLYETCSEDSLSFFKSLPESVKTPIYEAYHGSPSNPLEAYVYPETNIEFSTQVPFLFLGHTHYPMIKKVGETLIVNPGSIGQSRDFNKGSFAIVDTQDKKVEHIRYAYNRLELEKKIETMQDNRYLFDVLQREAK